MVFGYVFSVTFHFKTCGTIWEQPISNSNDALFKLSIPTWLSPATDQLYLENSVFLPPPPLHKYLLSQHERWQFLISTRLSRFWLPEQLLLGAAYHSPPSPLFGRCWGAVQALTTSLIGWVLALTHRPWLPLWREAHGYGSLKWPETDDRRQRRRSSVSTRCGRPSQRDGMGDVMRCERDGTRQWRDWAWRVGEIGTGTGCDGTIKGIGTDSDQDIVNGDPTSSDGSWFSEKSTNRAVEAGLRS